METWTAALVESLQEAPLLVGDLAGAPTLDRAVLGDADDGFVLHFKQKLGHLYEDALGHLLEQSDAVALLGSHLQVVDHAGITLGEMDFILRDGVACCDYHLELAVKFYLAHRSAEGWRYPGPDPRDNWHRKLKRMQTHQLRLSDDPHAQRLLDERFGISKVAVRQLIYGRLFAPIGAGGVPLPEGMHADGLRGRWLRCSEWFEWMGSASGLRIIPKVLWPVMLNPKLIRGLAPVSANELLKLGRRRCTMFITEDSPEPLFLVPDTWPDVANY